MTKNKPILGLENVKAVFVDFFGTLVCDDGESVEKVCKIIFNTGKAADIYHTLLQNILICDIM